jgi:endoglucanase
MRGHQFTTLLSLLLAAFGGIGAAASPLAVHVQGNHLVDANGKIVRLRGVNRAGSEYACVQNFGFFDGPVDAASIAAIKSWHVNTVRVPLNEDCWLGINVNNQYTGQPYRNAIIAYVQALNNADLYVILDLHWNAPGTQVANQQQPMADLDHGPAFWTSVATTFKDFPAVIFDLKVTPGSPSHDRVPQEFADPKSSSLPGLARSSSRGLAGRAANGKPAG